MFPQMYREYRLCFDFSREIMVLNVRVCLAKGPRTLLSIYIIRRLTQTLRPTCDIKILFLTFIKFIEIPLIPKF